MNGKDKCKLLKEIREEIARENNIKFESEECTFEGECSGTCPKCEEELRYLENEIDKKEDKNKSNKYNMDKSDINGRLDVSLPSELNNKLNEKLNENSILEEQMVERIHDSDEFDEIPTIYVDTGLPNDNEVLGRDSDIYKLDGDSSS